MVGGARTTHPALQVPVLLGLGMLAAYFIACYAFALESGRVPPRWLPPVALWMGNWQMFTLLDKGHSALAAEMGSEAAGFAPVDLDALFPYRWESGPRYARASFRRSRVHLEILGEATCGRLAARGEPAPEAVRFVELRWKKRLGRAKQPADHATRKELFTWRCGGAPRLPAAVGE